MRILFAVLILLGSFVSVYAQDVILSPAQPSVPGIVPLPTDPYAPLPYTSSEPDYATPVQTCKFDEYVGQNVDDVMPALEALDRPLRILHPMSQMTMDYSPDRINVNIDEDTRIIQTISCG